MLNTVKNVDSTRHTPYSGLGAYGIAAVPTQPLAPQLPKPSAAPLLTPQQRAIQAVREVHTANVERWWQARRTLLAFADQHQRILAGHGTAQEEGWYEAKTYPMQCELTEAAVAMQTSYDILRTLRAA